MKYPELVRQLMIRRMALGLRQADIGERMGLSTGNHIGRLENLQVRAHEETLERWCEALGLSLHYEVHVKVPKPRKKSGNG